MVVISKAGGLHFMGSDWNFLFPSGLHKLLKLLFVFIPPLDPNTSETEASSWNLFCSGGKCLSYYYYFLDQKVHPRTQGRLFHNRTAQVHTWVLFPPSDADLIGAWCSFLPLPPRYIISLAVPCGLVLISTYIVSNSVVVNSRLEAH